MRVEDLNVSEVSDSKYFYLLVLKARLINALSEVLWSIEVTFWLGLAFLIKNFT